MKSLIPGVLVLLLAGCSATDARSRLDFFDRLDYLREKYNATLNTLNYTEQVRVETSITREAQERYELLIEAARSESEVRLRYLAIFGLGFSKRLDAAPILRERLGDGDPIVRVTAAVALGHLGAPNTPVDRIKLMLDDPDPYVRLGALFALKLVLTPGQEAGLAPRLIRFLDDPDENIRNEAVHVMTRVRRLDFVDPLIKKGFRDNFMLVRLNSAMAIGALGPAAESAVPHLVELLKDLEAKVVEAAWWALKKITGQDFDRSYHSWRDWYDHEVRSYEYACPKDVDVVKESSGVCTKCGSTLMRRPRLPSTRKDVYTCPAHPEVLEEQPGKCPKCQADLQKKDK